MECTIEMYEQIAEKCKEEYGDDWNMQVILVLGKMDKNRCPLSCVDSEFCQFIMDMVDKFCEDGGIEELEYEIDEILFVEV